jgi:pilus assembly protein CpaB
MNIKALIPLVVGLGIAGLAAKLGLDFIRKAEGKQAKMVKLWTPVQDIKRGVSITEAMLRPLDFPAEARPPGALAKLERIVGRVPHTGAPAGVPILDSMLLPPGVNAGVRVPPGLRAVAVKVDESSGVDNHLEPGCHVDVVGVFTVRNNNRPDTIARTILEDVEVAAVGERLAPTVPEPGEEKERKSSRRERPARAVTLLVKPDQAPTLHLAEQKGKIKLCMRGALDQSTATQVTSVDEDDLLGVEKAEPEPQFSWSERLNELVSSFWKKDEPQAEPEPEPAPTPELQEQPKWAWVMAVQNGGERRVLGWRTLTDFQPTEISCSEGPNLFQDGPKCPPPNPPITTPPEQSKSQPASDGEPESESRIESEPEELFE